MFLPKAALKHTQFTFVIIALLVALGIVSYLTMPRSEDPQFDLPITLIEVVYPGATPQNVEALVVDPIEQATSELDDILKIATDINNGGARIEITFVYGVDPDDAYEDVLRAVNKVQPSLPQESQLFILKASPTSVNILQFAMWSEPMDYRLIDRYSEQLEKQLERFQEVNKAERWGLPEQIIEVSAQPDALTRHNLSINYLSNALAARAENVIPGFVDGEARRFNLKASGDFATLDEIKKTVIAQTDFSPIIAEDIAVIDYASNEPTYLAYFKNKPVVFVTVEQTKGSNIFEVTEKLLADVELFKQSLPDNIKLELLFKQADSVEERVDGFFDNLIQGLILVAILSLLFLGFRASLLITFTVPLSFVIAMGFLDISGFGLEQMSIVGLIIALGLLVDDAIVVTENIQSSSFDLHSPLQAAMLGASRVGWASTLGTFTTVFAFLPMLMLQSSSGDFMRSMPVTVSFVLIISLLLSLTLTPMMASRILKAGQESKWTLQHLISWFANTGYKVIIHGVLRHPIVVIIIAVVCLVGMLSFFPKIGLALFPKAEKPFLLVDIEAPPNTSIARTDVIVRSVAKQIEMDPLVASTALNIGNANPRIYYNEIPRRGQPHYGQILVQLNHYDAKSVNQLIADLREQFATMPEATVQIREMQQGPVTDPPITLRLMGENIDELAMLANKIEQYMRNTDGMVNIRNVISEPQVEVDLSIDYSKLAMSQISVTDLDSSLKAWLTGTRVGNLTDPQGNQYPVVVKGPSQDISQLDSIRIPNNDNELIPLQQFVTPTLQEGQPEFFHFQKIRTAKVSADAARGYSVNQLTVQLADHLTTLDLPASIRYEFGGEEEARKENFEGLSQVLLVAVFSIFACLVLRFRSFFQPIVIFTSMPFAVGGATVCLYATGYPFSIMAFVGMISLFGIVVNNAIILVDTVNHNLEQHQSLFDAVSNASSRRLPPITLTTLTTIGGLIPLTLYGGNLWAPLGWVIIGGLLVSTLSSLIVVPMLTYLFTKEPSHAHTNQ